MDVEAAAGERERERGDFEAVFHMKRNSDVLMSPYLFPIFFSEAVESLGAFEVAHAWKSKVTTTEPSSVVDETPTSSQISSLSGFMRRFPFFFTVTSQALSHFAFSVSHRCSQKPVEKHLCFCE